MQQEERRLAPGQSWSCGVCSTTGFGQKAWDRHAHSKVQRDFGEAERRECGCLAASTITDLERHAEWHEAIKSKRSTR